MRILTSEAQLLSLILSILCSFRVRSSPKMSFEESEQRALLLKEWSRYKYCQHQAEMAAVEELLESQTQALKELQLESEELYKAAISPDCHLFPFQCHGPCYTPPLPIHDAPDGKYNNITRVYTQWWSLMTTDSTNEKNVWCCCTSGFGISSFYSNIVILNFYLWTDRLWSFVFKF